MRLHPAIPMLRLVADDTKFDFIRFRRISFPSSAVLSIVAILLFFFHGLNFGIEFDVVAAAAPGVARIAQEIVHLIHIAFHRTKLVDWHIDIRVKKGCACDFCMDMMTAKSFPPPGRAK